jgi:hypothetical protein
MTAPTQPTTNTRPAPVEASRVFAGRRRLLQGASGVAPIMMTLVSRPVMAGSVCTPASSFASINASRPDKQYNCSGLTPGYWKQEQKFWDWPKPYVPSATPVPGQGGQPDYSPGKHAKPTWFDSVFGSVGGYSGKTLLDVLSTDGNDIGRDALARHIVAALLNAAKGYTPPTVLSVQTVKNIWSSFVTKGYYEPTAGIKWYADSSEPPGSGGLIAWLKSTMPI